MTGTIVNTCTIIVGAAKNREIKKKKYKNTLYTGLGLACLGIGLNITPIPDNLSDDKSTATW